MEMGHFGWNECFRAPKPPLGGNGTRNHQYAIALNILRARGRQRALLREKSPFLRSSPKMGEFHHFHENGWNLAKIALFGENHDVHINCEVYLNFLKSRKWIPQPMQTIGNIDVFASGPPRRDFVRRFRGFLRILLFQHKSQIIVDFLLLL